MIFFMLEFVIECDFMKKILVIFLILLSFPVLADEININSKNAIVINLNDNNILYEKNSNEQIYVASLTKIMTAIVAIEEIDNLQKEIIITEEMLSGIYEYSKAGLQLNDKVTYEDLLYGIILPSGADCVQAVEISLGGREKFVSLMNNLAKKLNLKSSHFSNGIGMDKDNHSSVADIASILNYALKNKTFEKIYTAKEYTMTNGLIVKATVEHYNSLDTSLIRGSKTGFTNAAGFCISAIYKSDEYNYLVVTANGDYQTGNPTHVEDAITLFKYYLDNYHYLTLYSKNDVITSIPILNSKQKIYDIKSNEIKLFLKKNIELEDLKIDLKKMNNITENNKKGDYLGTLNVSHNNKIIYTQDLILKNNIKYKTDINTIITIILITFIILLLIYNVLLRKKIHRLILKLKRIAK